MNKYLVRLGRRDNGAFVSVDSGGRLLRSNNPSDLEPLSEESATKLKCALNQNATMRGNLTVQCFTQAIRAYPGYMLTQVLPNTTNVSDDTVGMVVDAINADASKCELLFEVPQTEIDHQQLKEVLKSCPIVRHVLSKKSN